MNCETVWFQNLVKTKSKLAKKSIWTRAFVFRIVVGLFLWYLWVLNYKMVASIEGLQSFDPYQILELDSAADEKAIRKQYRKMSLLKHPDKNPDNPLAVQEFIRLTKAYNVSFFFRSNCSDFDRRDSSRQFFEVREPRWSWKLQRCDRNASIFASEGKSSASSTLCFLHSAGCYPWSGLRQLCRQHNQGRGRDIA